MSNLFANTTVAVNALYGDFKFKPYYHVGFHLDALTSGCCHIARTLIDLAATLLRFITLSLCVISIFGLILAPKQALDLLDNITATVIAAVTVAIHPVIVLLRTLSSMFAGYEKNVDDQLGVAKEDSDIYKEEESDIELATTLFPA